MLEAKMRKWVGRDQACSPWRERADRHRRCRLQQL